MAIDFYRKKRSLKFIVSGKTAVACTNTCDAKSHLHFHLKKFVAVAEIRAKTTFHANVHISSIYTKDGSSVWDDLRQTELVCLLIHLSTKTST